MANRFFTILVVPERTSQVRRIIVPAWLVRGGVIAGLFATALAFMMVLDYWYVMSQIGENKQLKLENRKLRQQVQVYRNKMTTIEATMDRIKTFTTRLKVITNIEDRDHLVENLNKKLPDAATNIGGSSSPATASTTGNAPAAEGTPQASAAAPVLDGDPDTAALRREWEELDAKFGELSTSTLVVEQTLQNQYELLADQKAFLAALPTRRPAVGYFTSGFGVRKSPFGGREKMHEGLDIANYPGTQIKATADGVVLFADSKAGYGQTVILDHGYGLETWYGHTKKVLVQKGQKIHRGEAIALLGNTGRSTGPHVHYEVRVHGTPVDPLSYILEN